VTPLTNVGFLVGSGVLGFVVANGGLRQGMPYSGGGVSSNVWARETAALMLRDSPLPLRRQNPFLLPGFSTRMGGSSAATETSGVGSCHQTRSC